MGTQKDPTAPVPDVCDVLRSWLARAMAGEVRAVAVITECQDESIHTEYAISHQGDKYALHFGAACLASRFLGVPIDDHASDDDEGAT